MDGQDEGRRWRRKVAPPDDFGSAAEFLSHVRSTYAADELADEPNRREALEDSLFTTGRQWDPADLARRDAERKPTITVNRLPAFIQQVVGNRRLNQTVIRVIPDNGGKKEVARIREGLIRNIQKASRAEHVYDKALENQVICGIGNFQVLLEYAHDDVFEQDLRIAAIPNPLAVLWDRMSVEPTGADAGHVFVVDTLPLEDFRRRYPGKTISDMGEWRQRGDLAGLSGWIDQDTVRIVSYWRMRARDRVVALMRDGTVQDVTDTDMEEWYDGVATNAVGVPMIREVRRKYAEMYVCTGTDLLEGPYRLPISRVPVLRVPGWEVNVEDNRYRFGLVRFLKDPQRLHNYWRSCVAEKLMGAARAKWVASDVAVTGYKDLWENAHTSDNPLLIYNGEAAAPPQRVGPVEMEPALIQEASMAAQDIKDVSNIHEASLGQVSNEVSGRAIMARQRVGEVGTVVYHDNLNMAIEECGRVLNELIPIVYDTTRTIKILGADFREEEEVTINDPENENTDITLGKYSVSVTTGPSYVTRRIEASESMLAMVNAMPQTMSVVADKIVEAQDWPGAEEVARRLRLTLPPGMLAERDKTDEQRAAEQAAAQQQQAAAQVEMERVAAELRERQARAEESEARARQALALAAKAYADIDRQGAETSADIMSQGRKDFLEFMDRVSGGARG